MLTVSMVAQIAGTICAYAPPFLIPYLHLTQGYSLTHAGLIAGAPLAGVTVSLVAWGHLVDRRGERLVLAGGLALASVAGLAASTATSNVATLALAWFGIGVGAASTNSASGRLIVGWFPPEQRGTAMGIRQAGLPLGVGITALLVPQLVEETGSLSITTLALTAISSMAALACWIWVVNPARPDRAAAPADNPYRADRTLVRIHVASMLLVIPQFTVWTYMLLWLIDGRGWSSWWAGVLVAASQLAGAGGRIGVGWWSDRVGSRLGPLRQVALAAAVVMLALGALEPTPVAVALIVAATVVTVADNGLAFTAVAEIGGPFWAGRAMGWQNTGQYLIAAAVPPAVGAAITGLDYAWSFALVAIFPVVALAILPREWRSTAE